MTKVITIVESFQNFKAGELSRLSEQFALGGRTVKEYKDLLAIAKSYSNQVAKVVPTAAAAVDAGLIDKSYDTRYESVAEYKGAVDLVIGENVWTARGIPSRGTPSQLYRNGGIDWIPRGDLYEEIIGLVTRECNLTIKQFHRLYEKFFDVGLFQVRVLIEHLKRLIDDMEKSDTPTYRLALANGIKDQGYRGGDGCWRYKFSGQGRLTMKDGSVWELYAIDTGQMHFLVCLEVPICTKVS